MIRFALLGTALLAASLPVVAADSRIDLDEPFPLGLLPVVGKEEGKLQSIES
jgi:hypothetical protein